MNSNTTKVNPIIEASWLEALKEEFAAPYFLELKQFLLEEKKHYVVFPPGRLIFNAFNLTPFDKVKVVILGQDPYHDVGQAHGLCFSVNEGTPHPKSLVNIFKELQNDIGFTVPKSGNLEKWAKQGILMINAILTVRAHSPGSHRNKGWETFTDAVIRKLSTDRDGLIFILWGAFAQEKSALIDTTKHRILRAAHPSPFSAHKGFFGCKHFSETNEILRKMGKSEIDWSL